MMSMLAGARRKELVLGMDITALFDATGASTTVFLDTLDYGAYGIALSFKSLPSLYHGHWHAANTRVLGHHKHKTDCAMEIE